MRAKFQELGKIEEDAVKDNLAPKQIARVNQILLQREGVFAVMQRPDIATKLNLSPEQTEALAEVNQGMRTGTRELFTSQRELMPNFMSPDGRFDRNAMQQFMQSDAGKAVQKKMDQARERFNADVKKQIVRLMSSKQRKLFDKLLGPPFDLKKLTNPAPAVASASATIPAAAKTQNTDEDSAEVSKTAPASKTKAAPAKKKSSRYSDD